VASLSLPGLLGGPHTITVAYSGDATFTPGKAALTEVVRLKDVSAQVRVTRFTLRHLADNLFRQTLRLRNSSRTAIQGPLYLVLDGLTPGVSLVNVTGSTGTNVRPGDPYLQLPVLQLLPGQSVKLDLQFADPRHVPIRFTPLTLAGSGLV
jgi:hypothetical protein